MSALVARGVALPGRLEPTDLELGGGTMVALLGPNGAGKTSLLHALAGTGRATGAVSLLGTALRSIPPRARPRVLGYVPASRDLAWPLSVRDFVTLTAPAAHPERVEETLGRFGLGSMADRRVDSLSTGERTRVLVARALLPEPAVLLLDEPFANLDPLWQLRLADELRARASAGCAILFSAHDLDFAGRIADRVLIVGERRVQADGAW